MKNLEIIESLLNLGKIPKNDEMTNAQFKEYDDLLISFEDNLSFDEAEKLMGLFSNDCDDLNWGLLHLIESVPYSEVDRYKALISKCSNKEFREIFEIRLNNWLNKQ